MASSDHHADLQAFTTGSRCRRLVDAAPYGFMLTQDNALLHLNPAAQALLGYPRDEIPTISQAFELFFPDVDYRRRQQLRWSALIARGQEDGPLVSRVRRPDGSTLRIELSPPIPLEDDLLLFALRDVTSAELAHEELLRSQHMLRDIERSALDFGLFRVRLDPDRALIGQVEFATPSMSRLLGSSSPLPYTEWFTRFLADDRDLADTIGRGLRSGVGTVDEVFRVQRSTVDIGFLHVVAHADHDPVSGDLLLTGVATDVTVIRRAEAERTDLSDRVRRARELEALGTLAGGIAHDFNNLLMAMQGHLAMAKAEVGPNHPAVQRLQRLEDIVQSGATLAGQLLRTAHSGPQLVQPLDLLATVKDAAGAFARTRKDLTLVMDLPSDPCQTDADRTQIERVILNLMVNAADAMPDGGTLTVRIERQPVRAIARDGIPVGDWVVLVVEDTGVGMDDDVREHIFEPFFSTKPAGKGTGLGLAAVHTIVRAHMGHVRVVSKPGQGSSFRIYLPASTQDVAASKREAVVVDRGRGTILVVDDEPGVREVVCEMLDLLGYRAVAAGSGEEALDLLSRRPVDAILLDLVMPGMGGREVLRRLPDLAPDLPVIVSSGYADAASLADLPREVLRVAKPYSLADLSAAITAALD